MPSPPRNLLPMLASRAASPFDSPNYVYDLKWAGVRALAHVDGARLSLTSRSGRDITPWFPELAGIAGQVKGNGIVLDGEIVALDDDGAPELALLRQRLCGGDSDDGVTCVYQAYDVLYAAGIDLTARTLFERKEVLSGLVSTPGPAVMVQSVDGDGTALFEAAMERRLPGIVAKAKTSRYAPGRVSSEWQEVAVFEQECFLVGGYVLGLGKEDPVAGLLLGEAVLPGRLRYAGMVQANVPGALIEGALQSLTRPVSPFMPAPDVARLVYWLRPELVAEVRFGRREADGRLRFPLFVTLRPDIAAEDVSPDAAERRAPHA